MAGFIPAIFSSLAPMVGPIVEGATGTGKAKAKADAENAKAKAAASASAAAIENARSKAQSTASEASAKMLKAGAVAGGVVILGAIGGLVYLSTRQGKKR